MHISWDILYGHLQEFKKKKLRITQYYSSMLSTDETFTEFLAPCEWHTFVVALNNLMNKHFRYRWFETPRRSCDVSFIFLSMQSCDLDTICETTYRNRSNKNGTDTKAIQRMLHLGYCGTTPIAYNNQGGWYQEGADDIILGIFTLLLLRLPMYSDQCTISDIG